VSDKHHYLQLKNKQLNYIENTYKDKQHSLDSETDKEYRLAISHIKDEINLIKDLL